MPGSETKASTMSEVEQRRSALEQFMFEIDYQKILIHVNLLI